MDKGPKPTLARHFGGIDEGTRLVNPVDHRKHGRGSAHSESMTTIVQANPFCRGNSLPIFMPVIQPPSKMVTEKAPANV